MPCVGLAAAVNAESSGLVTGALGGGLALAVMIYATAGVYSRRISPGPCSCGQAFWSCLLAVYRNMLGCGADV